MLGVKKTSGKSSVLTLSIFAFSLFSFLGCPNSADNSTNTDPEPIQTDDGKTYLKIENNTVYTVNVYINDPPLYGEASTATLHQVPANGSQQWELQPTASGSNGETLYFEYLIPVGGNITIPYYASNVENIKIKKLEEGKINTQAVPALGIVNTNSIFMVLQNNANDPVWVEQDNGGVKYTQTPHGAADRNIPTGNSAVFVLNNGTSLDNFTVGALARKKFPNTVLESGKIYSFSYDGNTAALLSIAHFDPDMGNKVWAIPTSDVQGKFLSMGLFAPRKQVSDGYIVLGRINYDGSLVTNATAKTTPYFATIAQNGSIPFERTINIAGNPSRVNIRSVVEEGDEFIFLGQVYYDTDPYSDGRPFILGTTSTGATRFFYRNFISDEEWETDDLYLNARHLVKSGADIYVAGADSWNGETEKNYIYLATVSRKSFDEAAHSDLWTSPLGDNVTLDDIVYDASQNSYMVSATNWDTYVENEHLDSILYFIDASTGVQKSRIAIPKYSLKKIFSVGDGYYAIGEYESASGNWEGYLRKLNPVTGSFEWSQPILFPSSDLSANGSAGIVNAVVDAGRLLLCGYTNEHGDNNDYKPWLLAFDSGTLSSTSSRLWELVYDEYPGYEIYSVQSNGIGSYILELYDDDNYKSILVSTDLMGRVIAQDKFLDPIPRNPSLTVVKPSYKVYLWYSAETYDDSDSEADEKHTVEYDETISLPDPPPRSGYQFIGWFHYNWDSEAYEPFTSTIHIKNNYYIYADWEEVVIPTIPGGINASASAESPANSITISWNAVTQAERYNIYRATTSTGTYTKVTASAVTGTAYTDTGLISSTTYYYKVSAVNGAGESGQSAYASATTQQAVPSTPTGVTATAFSSSSISISWNTVSSATGYYIYRAITSTGTYTKVTASAVTGTSYADTGLTASTTYYYKVSAVNSAGESGLSAYMYATTQSDSYSAPNAPTGVSAQALSSDCILISWNTVSGASGYYIYRADSAYGHYSYVGYIDKANYFEDSGLFPSTTYYYKVSATNNSGGENGLSDFAYAATLSENTNEVITLEPNGEYGYQYMYCPDSLFGGVQLIAGDVWRLEYDLSSNIDLDHIQVVFIDNGAVNNYDWTELSGYYWLPSNPVYANTRITGFIDIPVTMTATDASPQANMLVIQTTEKGSTPSLTILKLAFTKISGGGGSIAGSSYSNAIQIESGGVFGSFDSGLDAIWYTFYVYSQGSYHILSASDRYYSSIYTSDIVVDIYDSEMNLIMSDVDVGDNTITISETWDAGQWYVKVRPYFYSSSNKGTFALFFS
jgi:fibronectin type 3 domain-containing protein